MFTYVSGCKPFHRPSSSFPSMRSHLLRPKLFPRLTGGRKERELPCEFSHSPQRREGVKITRWQIVRNGFLESSFSDIGNCPQGRQVCPSLCAFLHTSSHKQVLPKPDPLEDRKQFQTYYLCQGDDLLARFSLVKSVYLCATILILPN